MTEEEAKQKYCPLMPIALAPSGSPLMTCTSPGYASGTGIAIPVRQMNCMGSYCMMWSGDGCGLAAKTART